MADPFFIVTPCRNATPWVGQCIKSVRQQSYGDWQMVVIDDASSDDTFSVAKNAAEGDSRIRVIHRGRRRYALRNVVEAIDRYSPHNSIVVVLDGDDWLSDSEVLRTLVREYASRPDLDALWAEHIHEDGSPAPLCRAIPPGVLPLDCDWRSSHLKTFRKRLIWGVDREVWQDESGDWWKSGYDVALYLPMLCMATRHKFLNRVCYVYNRSGRRDHTHPQQASNARRIWKKIAESEAQRVKKNVLFFVNGVSGGDKRFAWTPGAARPPMGILTLMARLRARGHEVTLCDRYHNPTWWPTRKTMERADVIGVYASTPNAADARYILDRTRKESHAKLLIGGPHASLYPTQLMEQADAVCKGEADDLILDLVETTAAGRLDAGRHANLDAVPFPAYDYLLSNDFQYRTDWPFNHTRPIGVLNTSRGCPHQCAFCDTRRILGRQWVGQSPERVVNDIIELQRLMGARGIYFREDNFACKPDRVRAIVDEMAKREVRIEWACEMRADRACDPELMHTMAAGGCKGIYVGFESGSQGILDLFNKGVTIAQSTAAADVAHENGIAIAASFVVDHPAETESDRAATDALIDYIRPHVVWRNKYRAPTEPQKMGVSEQ